jgi:hypothetical protein
MRQRCVRHKHALQRSRQRLAAQQHHQQGMMRHLDRLLATQRRATTYCHRLCSLPRLVRLSIAR